METKKKFRILVAKPDLDGHDRRDRLIAGAFEGAGMEVVYAGRHLRPEQMVSAAAREEVDLIGLSIPPGVNVDFIPRLIELLKENDAEVIMVIGTAFSLRDATPA